VALNRKIIDIARRNINSSFDLAKNLARAKNPVEAMEMQADHWREQLDRLTAQAEAMRTLSTQVAADVAKPTKRGMDEFKRRANRYARINSARVQARQAQAGDA
jgi:phasin family protein